MPIWDGETIAVILTGKPDRIDNGGEFTHVKAPWFKYLPMEDKGPDGTMMFGWDDCGRYNFLWDIKKKSGISELRVRKVCKKFFV